jgi:Transposase DDE domain
MVIREQREHRFSSDQVRQVLDHVLGDDLHAKRVASLSDATLGVLRSSSLAVCAIGQGLAAARGLNPKHATKQVDRLLSNPKINVDDILARWVPYIVGARTAIVVALDWTDFDADKQATIMLSLITDHGRATPLVWLTVDKRTLKDNRSLYEHRVLVRLGELLPAGIKVCVVADRGFGDQKLYRMLNEELCFDYVIRFRGNIAVTAITGETRTAAAWVRGNGRARVLRSAEVTADRYRVGTVVCVQDPDMKQAWCLAASSSNASAKELTDFYGRRWGIECSLRDTKDLRFGMGMGSMHVNSPDRRDRLWLINAFAVVLLTLLGAAGEALGFDRMLKTNTAKRRVHSLFRQGCILYDLIPMMPEVRLRTLMQRFSQMLLEQPLFADVFGTV